MAADKESHGRSERESTDLALHIERRTTDDELATQRADAEQHADQALDEARRHADEALKHSRAKLDEKLQGEGAAGSRKLMDVQKDRLREGNATREERATATELLSSERDTQHRALETLLSFERDQTDRHLLIERNYSDDAVDSRDSFLAVVSHDLRNMLGSVAIGAASLMDIPCDDEVGAAIARKARLIERSTVRMNRLVGDLLDVINIESGRLAMDPETHDATELLRETIEVFQSVAAAQKVSIRTEVKARPSLARYDHERILQVLANLVGNAIKFTNPGGTVEIVVERLEHEVRFAVADTGPGIAPDKLNAVFGRFWQAAKHERSGLGLGLYIAKSIVEAHGGRIWVDSRLGEGSTFYFTLPAD